MGTFLEVLFVLFLVGFLLTLLTLLGGEAEGD